MNNLPVLRIPGSNEGTNRGNTTPVVVIAPYEGIEVARFNLLYMEKLKQAVL